MSKDKKVKLNNIEREIFTKFTETIGNVRVTKHKDCLIFNYNLDRNVTLKNLQNFYTRLFLLETELTEMDYGLEMELWDSSCYMYITKLKEDVQPTT